MKNHRRKKKNEVLKLRGENFPIEQQTSSESATIINWETNPHAFNPYWPDSPNDKWICDKCGYEATPRTKVWFQFATIDTSTEDICPQCLINFLNENIPQLRKVNNNE